MCLLLLANGLRIKTHTRTGAGLATPDGSRRLQEKSLATYPYRLQQDFDSGKPND